MILFMALCAFLNRVRGGFFDAYGLSGARWLASIILACAVYVYTLSVYMAIITGAGFFIWALPGWGLYFAACTGTWDISRKCVKWIDELGYKYFPFIDGGQQASNYWRGIFCMGIRGGAYSLPLFAGLAEFNPIALLFWPVMFLQGFAYFAFKQLHNHGIDPTGYAEWLWGAVIGLLIAQSIY